MPSFRGLFLPVVRLLLPLAASGLVMTGVVGGERTASAQSAEVVTVAPPAPQFEFISARPSPHHVWAQGHWGYHPSYGHRWNPGSWQAPRPGYTWSQPGWNRVHGGWAFRHGGWRR